jgi:hypothetical protein
VVSAGVWGTWWPRLRTAVGLCFGAAPYRTAGLLLAQVTATVCTLVSASGIRVLTDAAVHSRPEEAIAAATVMALAAGAAAALSDLALRLTTEVAG